MTHLPDEKIEFKRGAIIPIRKIHNGAHAINELEEEPQSRLKLSTEQKRLQRKKKKKKRQQKRKSR